jgi:hypothetical protein
MQLLEEYVNARVNAAEDARLREEREVLRRVRERSVVVRWREAAQARRTVRAARRAAAGRAAGTAGPTRVAVQEDAAAPVPEQATRDLARSAR